MSGCQEKITRHVQDKTQFEDSVSEREPDMAVMLKLTDQGLKTTIMNMLRALMG